VNLSTLLLQAAWMHAQDAATSLEDSTKKQAFIGGSHVLRETFVHMLGNPEWFQDKWKAVATTLNLFVEEDLDAASIQSGAAASIAAQCVMVHNGNIDGYTIPPLEDFVPLFGNSWFMLPPHSSKLPKDPLNEFEAVGGSVVTAMQSVHAMGSMSESEDTVREMLRIGGHRLLLNNVVARDFAMRTFDAWLREYSVPTVLRRLFQVPNIGTCQHVKYLMVATPFTKSNLDVRLPPSITLQDTDDATRTILATIKSSTSSTPRFDHWLSECDVPHGQETDAAAQFLTRLLAKHVSPALALQLMVGGSTPSGTDFTNAADGNATTALKSVAQHILHSIGQSAFLRHAVVLAYQHIHHERMPNFLAPVSLCSMLTIHEALSDADIEKMAWQAAHTRVILHWSDTETFRNLWEPPSLSQNIKQLKRMHDLGATLILRGSDSGLSDTHKLALTKLQAQWDQHTETTTMPSNILVLSNDVNFLFTELQTYVSNFSNERAFENRINGVKIIWVDGRVSVTAEKVATTPEFSAGDMFASLKESTRPTLRFKRMPSSSEPLDFSQWNNLILPESDAVCKHDSSSSSSSSMPLSTDFLDLSTRLQDLLNGQTLVSHVPSVVQDAVLALYQQHTKCPILPPLSDSETTTSVHRTPFTKPLTGHVGPMPFAWKSLSNVPKVVYVKHTDELLMSQTGVSDAPLPPAGPQTQPPRPAAPRPQPPRPAGPQPQPPRPAGPRPPRPAGPQPQPPRPPGPQPQPPPISS
jgi:hypothetical protein